MIKANSLSNKGFIFSPVKRMKLSIDIIDVMTLDNTYKLIKWSMSRNANQKEKKSWRIVFFEKST